MTMVWQADGLYESDLAITRPASYPEPDCMHPESLRQNVIRGVWIRQTVGFQCGVCKAIVMKKVI